MWGRWLAMLIAMAGCGRISFDATDAATAIDVPTDAPIRQMFAATMAGELYEIDPLTLEPTLVLPALCWNVMPALVLADIAIDVANRVIVTARAASIHVAEPSGKCTSATIAIVDMFGAEVANGMLYAVASNQNLYVANPTSGNLTLVGPMGLTPGGDIAWSGTQMIMSVDAGGLDSLATVDVTTGQGAVYASTAWSAILGLTFHDARLYGFASTGEIVELDPATGGTLRQRATGLGWTGAATTF